MYLNKKADGIVDDIGIAAYLIEPGRSSYSLKAVAERYLAANNGEMPLICRRVTSAC